MHAHACSGNLCAKFPTLSFINNWENHLQEHKRTIKYFDINEDIHTHAHFCLRENSSSGYCIDADRKIKHFQRL